MRDAVILGLLETPMRIKDTCTYETWSKLFNRRLSGIIWDPH